MLDHVAIRVPDRVASRRFYHSGYVGAFVLDPYGNTVEAVNRKR